MRDFAKSKFEGVSAQIEESKIKAADLSKKKVRSKSMSKKPRKVAPHKTPTKK